MELRQDDLIIVEIDKSKLVTGLNTHNLCQLPYPNHPKGCPNYSVKKGCPPHVQRADRVFDLDKEMYMIGARFDFGNHIEKMKDKHPDWSDRQLGCVLYWQGTLRKRLKEVVADFLRGKPDLTVNFCPVAHGINMTGTMKNIGVELEWMPKKYSWCIAMVGHAQRLDD